MSEGIPVALETSVGVIALAVAIALLVSVEALYRVAKGGAIVQSISYVVAAVLSLAASVLVGWLSRFPEIGISPGQARLGSELLAVAAMVFFAIYFIRVREALSRFLSGSQDVLAKIQRAAEEEESG